MKQHLHLSIFAFSIPFILISQGRFDKVEITTTQLSDHTYMLEGAGGNNRVSVGEDGIFVIDDQFASLSDKILNAIKALSDKPLKFLVTLKQKTFIKIDNGLRVVLFYNPNILPHKLSVRYRSLQPV